MALETQTSFLNTTDQDGSSRFHHSVQVEKEMVEACPFPWWTRSWSCTHNDHSLTIAQNLITGHTCKGGWDLQSLFRAAYDQLKIRDSIIREERKTTSCAFMNETESFWSQGHGFEVWGFFFVIFGGGGVASTVVHLANPVVPGLIRGKCPLMMKDFSYLILVPMTFFFVHFFFCSKHLQPYCSFKMKCILIFFLFE